MESMIGVLIAALLMTFGIKTYTEYQTASNQAIIAAATATEWKQITTAATSYIQTNATAIQATATATTPAIITVAMLQAPTVALLPASYTSTNPYGQTWQVQILEIPDASGNLQALVMTTGGQQLLDKEANKIASLLGASGGFIPKNDTGLYGTPNTAYGVAGAWKVSTSCYSGVTTGELSALLTFNNGQLQSPYLYRNQVPGQAQLNTMNTPLIMAATQTLNSACTTTGSIAQDGDGAVLSCQSGTWQQQGSAYWKDPVANMAALPTCNAASAWQTRVVKTPTVGVGQRAYTCNGTTWSPLAVDDNGNMTIAGTMTVGQAQINTVVTEGTACGSTGLVARDGTGLLLSCQSSVWKSGSVSLGQSSCYYATLSYHGSAPSRCAIGYYMAGVQMTGSTPGAADWDGAYSLCCQG